MYQQVIIVGNLGRDPEMRYLENGTPVTEFSVAVNRVYSRSDGTKGEDTTWWTVTCWRRLAEITYQYLRKGRQVMVIGKRIDADAWIDKSTGEARSKLKITADDVRFMSGETSSGPGHSGEHSGGGYEPQTEEDLPF